MTVEKNRILRLILPQWQGGDLPGYRVGAHILAAIAPSAAGPVETIDVAAGPDAPRPVENGIRSRQALQGQLAAATSAIAKHSPDAIVTFGGDCLVSLAPFAYLSGKYGDELAVLWIDAHPDIMGKEQYANAHAHVLGMLLGLGDEQFDTAVTRPADTSRTLYLGLTDASDWEKSFIARHGLASFSPEDLLGSVAPVLAWLRATGARKVAVHLDLDVLDPANHDFLYFRNPDVAPEHFAGIAQGRMQMHQIIDLLGHVASEVEVVGLTIAEYLPWSAIKLAQALEKLPLLK